MKFDIIIPISENVDRLTFIRCLESCAKQKTEHLIYPLCVCSKKYFNQIEDILEQYSVPIVIIDEEGVCECINKGIQSTSNERIIILNINDILNPDAIYILSQHQEEVIYYINQESFSLYNVKISNIKRSALSKLHFWFEQYYAPHYHNKFLLNCIFNDVSIEQLKTNIYSIEPDICSDSKKIENIIYNLNNSNSRELTCIIPFKNEKSEVERTILSIYATSKNTNIVLINDCSDDWFDYSFIKTRYPNIKYIENKQSIGHGNIDLGVVNSDSKYCILLDAHMRFYEQDWDERILQILKDNPNSLVYCNTTIMHENNGIYYNEDNSQRVVANIGAKVNLDPLSKDNIGIFQHRWAYKSTYKDENIHITPNVLGACYAFSIEHYWNIGGTYGLLQYGLSEAALAVKTWLMGGKVFRIQDLYVGHIYRSKFPYKLQGYSSFLNDRFLINLFIQDSSFKEKCLEYSRNRLNKDKWKIDYDNIWNRQEMKLLKYINHYQSKFIHDITWFQENINNKFA